ncbi:MAG: tetratricopeptide repeat protein [Bacteroidales bacterium]|nr:tetratricopeptide repeat protein [Bacteroidales bacterium]
MKNKIAYILLIISVIASTNCLFAQTGPSMSVQDFKGAEKDTLLALMYNEKANDYLVAGEIDSAAYYAEKAFYTSRKLFFREGKATAQVILARIAYLEGSLHAAVRNYFGALMEYDMLSDTLSMAWTNIQIGSIFKEAAMFDKALEYFLKAQIMLSGRVPEKEKAGIYRDIADAYIQIGKYQNALDYYIQLLRIYRTTNRGEDVTYSLSRIIYCYNEMSLFDKSLEYNLELLELYRKNGDSNGELIALNNIGYIYKYLEKFDEAINYFNAAVRLEEKESATQETNPITLVNIGIVYQNMGNYSSSLIYLKEAYDIVAKGADTEEKARLLNLMANIYYHLDDLYNARIFNRQATTNASEVSSGEVLKACYLTSSLIDEKLYNYESSLAFYKQYLDIRDSLENEERKEKDELVQQQFVVERTIKEIELLLVDEENRDLELQQLRLEAETRQQQLDILQRDNELNLVTIQNQELEKNKALQDLLLAEERLAAERKDREIDDLKQTEQIQSLELKRAELEQEQSIKEIEVLTKDKELNELALSKVKARNKFLLFISALALFILFLVYLGLRYAKKTNKILSEQKEEIKANLIIIDQERKKSDDLLLNILPEETATELKEKGTATPRHYDHVSVLFTDFVGFTQVAELMTPQELIEELNKCFLAFDTIIDKHNLEKIKTIGDAYMCAGGIPVPNKTNPVDIVAAGLEIQKFMAKMKVEKEANGESYWEIRLGIHTGQVVAGVVGKNKFAYDIWGDAVNIASRMESSGKSGKVNISGETYHLVKQQYQCTYRGKIKAKNKGEVDMYFVEGKM